MTRPRPHKVHRAGRVSPASCRDAQGAQRVLACRYLTSSACIGKTAINAEVFLELGIRDTHPAMLHPHHRRGCYLPTFGFERANSAYCSSRPRSASQPSLGCSPFTRDRCGGHTPRTATCTLRWPSSSSESSSARFRRAGTWWAPRSRLSAWRSSFLVRGVPHKERYLRLCPQRRPFADRSGLPQ